MYFEWLLLWGLVSINRKRVCKVLSAEHILKSTNFTVLRANFIQAVILLSWISLKIVLKLLYKWITRATYSTGITACFVMHSSVFLYVKPRTKISDPAVLGHVLLRPANSSWLILFADAMICTTSSHRHGSRRKVAGRGSPEIAGWHAMPLRLCQQLGTWAQTHTIIVGLGHTSYSFLF